MVDSQNKSLHHTILPKITFDDLTNSIISSGPFYYYIVDFYDMSISNVSGSIFDIQGFNPEKVKFNDILNTIHPKDLDYVVQSEAFLGNFFILYLVVKNY